MSPNTSDIKSHESDMKETVPNIFDVQVNEDVAESPKRKDPPFPNEKPTLAKTHFTSYLPSVAQTPHAAPEAVKARIPNATAASKATQQQKRTATPKALKSPTQGAWQVPNQEIVTPKRAPDYVIPRRLQPAMTPKATEKDNR